MSTSIIYHAFNIKGVKHKSVKFIGKQIVFQAEMSGKLALCPLCKSRNIIYKGSKYRSLLLGKCNMKTTVLKLKVHRLNCKSCGKTRWPNLPFVTGKHRYTNTFAILAMDLLRFATIKAVSSFLDVSWDLIKEIHKRKLQSTYKNIDLSKIQYISIDEFSIKKRHSYMTIVIDLATGRIIHAAEGKNKQAVASFLRKLYKRSKVLKAVSIDMSPAYFAASVENLPGVDIVIDKFHVSALMNRALDDLRKDQHNSLNTGTQKALKGTKFLLLANYDNLAKSGKVRLNRLLKANKPLFIAYSIKEQFRLFWDSKDIDSAQHFLKIWCEDALKSGIKQIAKFVNTVMTFKTAFLNYFKHRITSGKIEGIVNKIKTLKRQAYGFRDMVYFKLRLFHLHVQRYSLNG